jgi:hypothetical protein
MNKIEYDYKLFDYLNNYLAAYDMRVEDRGIDDVIFLNESEKNQYTVSRLEFFVDALSEGIRTTKIQAQDWTPYWIYFFNAIENGIRSYKIEKLKEL